MSDGVSHLDGPLTLSARPGVPPHGRGSVMMGKAQGMNWEHLTKKQLIELLQAERSAASEFKHACAESCEHQHRADEIQTHQLELEAQNEALREAQGLLEDAR